MGIPSHRPFGGILIGEGFPKAEKSAVAGSIPAPFAKVRHTKNCHDETHLKLLNEV